MEINKAMKVFDCSFVMIKQLAAVLLKLPDG